MPRKKGDAASASLAPAEGERAGGRGQAKRRPSSLLDTRVIYCRDNLEQLQKLPDACIALIDLDPLVNTSRNDPDSSRTTGQRGGGTRRTRAFGMWQTPLRKT